MAVELASFLVRSFLYGNLNCGLPFLVDKLECMTDFSTCDFLIRSMFFPVLPQVVCDAVQIRVGIGDLTN